jgi:hypothetical protein
MRSILFHDFDFIPVLVARRADFKRLAASRRAGWTKHILPKKITISGEPGFSASVKLAGKSDGVVL